MARGEQILRHWNLLRMLQTRGEGIPLRDLATEFNVNERTIQRDFEILEELGFPIEHEDDVSGKRFWRMPPDFFRSGPLVLGVTEAVSLHLAEHMLTPLAGTLFTEGLQSVLAKIRSAVPARALDHFALLDETLLVRRLGQTDYSAQADIIETLTSAIRNDRTVEITYHALWRGERYATRLDPYGLVLYDADLFAIGHSHRVNDLRVFKIARIRQAATTADSFLRPADFCLEDQFKRTFGIVQGDGPTIEVVARFTGPAAALVEERVWHESQQLAWLDADATLFDEAPDEPDALLATFQLDDLVEFKRWILGFGVSAEVLRPDALRRELRDELRATARRYDA